MIDHVYVARLIEQLNKSADEAEHAGASVDRKLGEIMRRSARLLHAMQREAEIKSVAREIMRPIIERVEIVDG